MSNVSKIDFGNFGSIDFDFKASDNSDSKVDDVGILDEIDLILEDVGEFLTGVDDFFDSAKATIVVAYTTIASGTLKLSELIADGICWCVGTATSEVAELVGAEEFAADLRDVTKKEIAKDRTAEFNEFFYENTSIGRKINEDSWLKYDSETAKTIQNISLKVVEFTAATAATIATGGLAAPVAFGAVFGLGAFEGIGKSAEERYQDPNNNSYDTASILLDGIGNGFDWYAKGKLGAGGIGAFNAVSNSVSQVGMGNTVKFFTSSVKDALKQFSIKNLFTKDSLKNMIKNGILDADQLVDSLAIGVDNITTAVNSNESIDWGQITKEIAIAYGLNCAFSGFTNLFSGNKANVSNEVEDIFSGSSKTGDVDFYNQNNSDVSLNSSEAKVNLDAEISAANYYTSKGNFYTINVNSLNDISVNDLLNLTNKNNVLFSMNDGKTYNINTLESILNTSSQLKRDLILDVENIDDPILKARKLYVELNKKVHYDMNYFKGTQETKNSILNKITTFENLNEKNTIVCKGWAELYSDLLKSCGFDESQVKIVNRGVHRWVEIDLENGKILSADATEFMNGATDFACCKAGMSTNGFIILDNNYSGLRPKTIYDNKEGNIDFINYQRDWLSFVDKVLGYVGDNGYLLDELEKSDNLFSNIALYDKLFGEQQFNKNVDFIFDLDIPDDMDGYEVYAFYNLYKKKLLGDSSHKVSLSNLFRNTGDMIEPMNLMTYYDDDRVIIQLYSKTLGKIRFDSFPEMDNFLNQINLVD